MDAPLHAGEVQVPGPIARDLQPWPYRKGVCPIGASTRSRENCLRACSLRTATQSGQTFTPLAPATSPGRKRLEGAYATAKLIDQIPGAVFAAGDLAYEDGTAANFRDCYGPTWGRYKDRTRPTLGNHEYSPTAAEYFKYWGALAGPPDKGYYSYDLGVWHIIALNTNWRRSLVWAAAARARRKKLGSPRS